MATPRTALRILPGDLSRLHSTKETIEPPKAGEVQIKVRSIGLNFADVASCLGLYNAVPPGEFIPGLEAAGEVVAVGAAEANQQKRFAVGDRVFAVTRFGAYTDRLNIHTNYVEKIPADWSFDQGVAFPVQAITAWYSLYDLGNVKQYHTVLVHSAAGGVGLFAVDILQKLGCTVIGTVSSLDKANFLVKRTGIPLQNWIIRTTAAEFEKQLVATLKALNKKGVDIILDSLSGDFFDVGYRHLNAAGRIIAFGAGSMMTASDKPSWLSLGWKYWNRPRLDPLMMMAENKSVLAFNLIWLYDDLTKLQPLMKDLMQYKWNAPHVGHTYDFSKAQEALRFFQTGKSVGKIVLQVPQ